MLIKVHIKSSNVVCNEEENYPTKNEKQQRVMQDGVYVALPCLISAPLRWFLLPPEFPYSLVDRLPVVQRGHWLCLWSGKSFGEVLQFRIEDEINIKIGEFPWRILAPRHH